MNDSFDRDVLMELGRREVIREQISFWRWFRREGFSRLIFNRWTLLHLVVGVLLAIAVKARMSELSRAALLPLGSILIGLAFAWGGNALALLQTMELRKAGESDAGRKFTTFLFTYQMAILAVLCALVVWGLLALGLADDVKALHASECAKLLGRTGVFALSSLALRECWQVVLGTQSMLAMRHIIQTASKSKDTQ